MTHLLNSLLSPPVNAIFHASRIILQCQTSMFATLFPMRHYMLLMLTTDSRCPGALAVMVKQPFGPQIEKTP